RFSSALPDGADDEDEQAPRLRKSGGPKSSTRRGSTRRGSTRTNRIGYLPQIGKAALRTTSAACREGCAVAISLRQQLVQQSARVPSSCPRSSTGGTGSSRGGTKLWASGYGLEQAAATFLTSRSPQPSSGLPAVTMASSRCQSGLLMSCSK